MQKYWKMWVQQKLYLMKLNSSIEEIILNKSQMKEMGEKALKVSITDAEEKIYEQIEKCLNNK